MVPGTNSAGARHQRGPSAAPIRAVRGIKPQHKEGTHEKHYKSCIEGL